jgi:mono/diheme cytochrome c family protein
MLDLNKIVKDKLKEIKTEPGKVFGLVYPFIFIIVTIICFIYVFNLQYVARQNVNPPLPDSTMQKDLPVVQAKTIPPIDITKVSVPTQELMEKGKSIFTSVCSSCHGLEGKGNGPASTGLNPPPRNFTSKSGWKSGPKLSQIFQTLQDGIPGTGMASYEYLTPEEKFGLAHYIRATFVPDPPKDSQEDLTGLDQLFNLSKGKEIPAQIPVAEATKFVMTDNDSIVQNITRIMRNAALDQNDPGAQVFNKVSINKFKAFVSLSRTMNWKQNEKLFVDIIVYNINQNGFNREVYNLSSNEWDDLYKYLNRLL